MQHHHHHGNQVPKGSGDEWISIDICKEGLGWWTLAVGAIVAVKKKKKSNE